MSEQISIIEQKLREKLDKDKQALVQPKEKGKRQGYGSKLRLKVNLPQLSMDTECRHEEIESRAVIQVVRVRRSDEAPVKYGANTTWHYIYKDEAGNEVQEADVRTDQILPDGSIKKDIQEFEQTKEMEISEEDLRSIDRLNDYAVISYRQLWGDNAGGLKQLAEHLVKSAKFAVSKLVLRKGFTEYFSMIYPQFNEDKSKFIIMMALCQRKLLPTRWMDANVTAEAKVESKEKPISILEAF